jgi:hypothetical protein
MRPLQSPPPCAERSRTILHLNNELYEPLSTRLNIASTELGRQARCRAFDALRPAAGAPIDDFFTKLIETQNQLIGTEEAITTAQFKTHVLGVLPKCFEVTEKILKGTPGTTIESIQERLIEDERNQAATIEPALETSSFSSFAQLAERSCYPDTSCR